MKFGVAVRAGLLIAALAVAWLLLAPPSLGGRAIYLVTSGVSMRPTMEGGDLVVVRDASTYAVGDVVAYDDPHHGRILHRIIEQRGDRYVLQGDNNPGPDWYQPSNDEIIGKVWLHLPVVGGWLTWLEQRIVSFALLVVAGGLFAGAVWLRHTGRSDKRDQDTPASRPRRAAARLMPVLGTAGRVAMIVIASVALLSLLLALVAYRSDAWEERETTHEYVQRGVFTYSSPAPAEIYPSGAATTGQPIYLDSMSELVVEFSYFVESDLPVNVDAEVDLQAIIENEHGWSRPLDVTTQPPSSDAGFSSSGFLQLDGIEDIIESVEEFVETSEEPVQYWVTVAPVVFLDGTVGQQAVQDVFTPRLRFAVEPGLLRVDPVDSGEVPFTVTAVETVTNEQSIPNDVTILGTTVDVQDARLLSVLGLATSGVAGAALAYLIRRALAAPEPDQIAAKHGSRIVTLQAARLRAPARLVEVAAFDELLQISNLHKQVIIHYVRDGVHYYFVQAGDSVYGYRTVAGEVRPALADTSVTQAGLEARQRTAD